MDAGLRGGEWGQGALLQSCPNIYLQKTPRKGTISQRPELAAIVFLVSLSGSRMSLASCLRRVQMPNELTCSSENFGGWEPGLSGSLTMGMAAVAFGGECFYIMLSAALSVQGEFLRKKERLSFLLLAPFICESQDD